MTAALAAVIVGCGGSDSSDVDPAALALTGRPVVQDREVATRASAQELLIDRCMRRAGFDYQEATYDEILAERQRDVSQPYGFSSRANVARAVRDGQLRGRDGAAIRRKDRYRESLSSAQIRAYQRALNGKPDRSRFAEIKLPDGSRTSVGLDGCQGRAIRSLYDDVAQWSRVEIYAYYVRVKTVRDTIDDTAVREAADRWKACARRAHIASATPFVAAKDGPTMSSQQQSRLIETIWRCQQKARLVQTALVAERRHARDAAAEYERELLAYREGSRTAMARAERVLASQP